MKHIERHSRTSRQLSLRLRMTVKFAVLASSGSLAPHAFAQEVLPTGGQIVSGQGTIAQSGNTLTVTQSSDRMIANWQNFSIAAGHTVQFAQPDVSSVALNRVVGQDPSQILGSLNANGRVFLVNPNGVLIGAGAQVQTGGFVASTLAISDSDFLAGVHRFAGTGGAIRNEGDISGSVVALIAPSVVNDGTITGNTALAAGTNVLLDFAGDGLLSVEVSASTVETLVANNGLIRADGGVAILTAKGASDALQGVVNNSGTIQARTLANREGRILLLADLEHGEANVGGTLDASAPGGGDGGFIETSGRSVQIADDVRITTQSAAGEDGDWLIDPNDFTIAASGGNMLGSTLSNILSVSNVSIATALAGTPEGNGDIFVNDSVSWSNNTLTLAAERNIVVNTAMNASGTAGLVLGYGQGAPTANNSARIITNAPINLAPTGTFSTRLGNDGAVIDYTIITSVGTAGSSNDGTLQGMRGDVAGHYVLGADIDASATSGWNGGQGFTPIVGSSGFSGIFDGLGHNIDALYINRPSTISVGLFASTDGSAILRNVAIRGSAIVGLRNVGGLVGLNFGTISDVQTTGSAAGFEDNVGGVAGINLGSVRRSSSLATTAGFGRSIGGLVGNNFDIGRIEDSHAVGTVSGAIEVGGLVGTNDGDVVSSYATGPVTSLDRAAGGLVGLNGGLIVNSYATGAVAGVTYVGGLVGFNESGSNFSNIRQSYATGAVSGTRAVGGLIGINSRGVIADSFATGTVSGNLQVGGLVGLNRDQLVRVYASGAVTGNTSTGALVGELTDGLIDSGFYDSDTTGQTSACGAAAVTCAATGLTTQAMKDPFTFIDAGFNFDTVWGKSRTGENAGYMVLGAISATEYEYYVRLSGASLQRTYGDANPSLSGVALDGIGAGNVTLGWGSAVAAGANAGAYSFADANVFNAQVSAGTAADYYFDYGGGTLTVNARAVSLSGTRVYDGTTNVAAPALTLSNLVAGESLTLSGVGTMSDRNAGDDKTVSLGTLTLGDGTGRASNYTLVGGTHLIDITRQAINVTSVAADDKVYDGTTLATLDLAGASFAGLIAGDDVSVAGATGAFSDKNAGTGKTVSVTGLLLGGADASNYVLTATSATTLANITPRAITAVTGITANDKNYDGTTAVTLNTGNVSFVGALAGDDLVLAGAQAGFANADPAMDATVIIDGVSLGGADAGNYVLANTSATTTASINAAFVPPLQPEQVLNHDTQERDDNLFPVPDSEVLTNPPSIIIDTRESTRPTADPELVCGLAPDGTSRCRIELPSSQQ